MDTSHYNCLGNYYGRRYLRTQDIPVIFLLIFAMFVKVMKSRKELWFFRLCENLFFFKFIYCLLKFGE
jgi:hypothetical protein